MIICGIKSSGYEMVKLKLVSLKVVGSSLIVPLGVR